MRYALLGIGVAAVLATAGCGDRAGSAGPAAAPGGDELLGRTFTATAITEQGKARELPAGTSLTLRFTDDGRLVTNAGCNTLSGAVTTTGGRLDAADLSITEMGCDPERHAQDERLAAFFTSNPSWRLDGDTLVLSQGGTELVLAEEKAPALAGTVWKIDTLIKGEVAGATPAGVESTMTFAAHEVRVSGLCNLHAVPLRISDSTLTFEPGPMTLKACAPDIMSVEQTAIAVLDGEATYRIDGRTLTITKGDQGLRLTGA